MKRIWVRALATAACIIGAIVVLWILFGPLVVLLGGDALDRLSPKDRLDEIGSIQGRIGAVLSAAAIGGGLYYTARKFFLDRDKQYTDRFSTAVDHLSSSEETLRAGGVRALERILHDSPVDRNRVLKSLTGFLRKQPHNGRDRDDITAAIETLRERGRPPRRFPDHPLNLRAAQLGHADLHAIPLPQADLTNTQLTGADLAQADLTGAHLVEATLIAADLTDAVLAGAHLNAARLTNADLTNARLTGAVLTHADLSGAIMRNTDLRGAIGLTTEQLEHTHVDQHTRLPGGIERPLQAPAARTEP